MGAGTCSGARCEQEITASAAAQAKKTGEGEAMAGLWDGKGGASTVLAVNSLSYNRLHMNGWGGPGRTRPPASHYARILAIPRYRTVRATRAASSARASSGARISRMAKRCVGMDVKAGLPTRRAR